VTPGVDPTLTYLLAGVIVAGGLGGVLAVLATLTPPSLRIPLVVSALWHVGLLAAVAYVGYGALHVDDPVRYDQISAVIADQARRGMMPNFSPFEITSVGYYCWVAAFYAILGHHPLIPQLMNVLLALVAGVLTHRLTRRVGGSDRAAWLAALAVLLYPTLAVWSVMLLKDILAVVFFLLCVDLALTVSERPAPWAWPLLAVCAFAMSTTRFYLGVLALGMGIVIGLAACVQTVRRRNARDAASTRSALVALAGAALLMLTLVGAFQIGEGPWYLQVLVKRSSLAHEQAALSGGGSSLEPKGPSFEPKGPSLEPKGPSFEPKGPSLEPKGPSLVPEDFTPTGGSGAALSRGGSWVWKVVRFFLVPLPSQTGGTLVQIGKLDGLFWWPLIVLALWGLRQGWSTSWQGTLTVALPIAVLAIFYAVVLNNAGTILRYRAALFPLGAILASLGVDGLAATAPARVRVLWKRFA